MKVSEHLRRARPCSPRSCRPGRQGHPLPSMGIDPLMEFADLHQRDLPPRGPSTRSGHGLLPEDPCAKRPGTIGICATIKAVRHRHRAPPTWWGQPGVRPRRVDRDELPGHRQRAGPARGDATGTESPVHSGRTGHAHAVDMVKQMRPQPQAKYRREGREAAPPTSASARCLPKSVEALNLGTDIAYLKRRWKPVPEVPRHPDVLRQLTVPRLPMGAAGLSITVPSFPSSSR